MMTWSELLHRLVLVQRTSRLCAVRDLDELDVVGRIMRKDNYLIGMLNAGEGPGWQAKQMRFNSASHIACKDNRLNALLKHAYVWCLMLRFMVHVCFSARCALCELTNCMWWGRL
jgi:hypothetical protein